MSQKPVLCIAANLRGRGKMISELAGRDVFPEHIVCESVPATTLQELKASGRPIVLLLFGTIGHEAIKFLCDDYDKPKQERRVKWIHSNSTGLDRYRLGELTQEMKDVEFTSSRGSYSCLLAIQCVYSILYFQRETVKLQENRKEHRWDPFDTQDPRGCKVGILGYGSIGKALAKMLQPMGMAVTGVKRSSKPDEVDEYGACVVSGLEATERVICESDFLVNILPGTPETKHMFNAQTFLKMKPTAVYINIGRGLTQNEEDLATALRNNVIAGAALDVFEVEPLPLDSPLFELPDNKILLTSHNACVTKESFPAAVGLINELGREFLENGCVSSAYHPDISRGY